MERKFNQTWEDIVNKKSLRHYYIQSGVCPPHNFIQHDNQWVKCTHCGQIKPIYNIKIS